MKTVQIILWSIVAAAVVIVAGFWLVGRDQRSIAAIRAPAAQTVAADFELTAHNGMIQTDEGFRGQRMLVFFGFANCPDVWPMGFATIAQVMDDLEAEAVQPLFVTVDPERDTPAVLADYIPQFGPGILGLSGSPEQIERTAKTFKIYYSRIEEASAPGGYTMGHTSSVLLFDPQGAFVRLYQFDEDPAQIASDLRERVGT